MIYTFLHIEPVFEYLHNKVRAKLGPAMAPEFEG